ncbi:MAG: response regulator transcription factor [Candidatus Promineifilaceae bacterium]|nr:response regulator transcription factor [Candidatus Promineifilaceae bacterium]
MASILIVEDHHQVAELLVRLLQRRSDHRVIGVAASAEEALERLDRLSVESAGGQLPDLALIDVSLPEMNGIELLQALQRSYPALPCLMLSGHKEGHYVQRSLAAGARGYVTKENPRILLEGVRQVLAGQIFVGEDLR